MFAVLAMISSLCWVPRGAAKPVPERAQPSTEELEAMAAGAHSRRLLPCLCAAVPTELRPPVALLD